VSARREGTVRRSHKLDRYITQTLGQFFEYVPVCPEIEYGLRPRERSASRVTRSPRLVTSRTGWITRGHAAMGKTRLKDWFVRTFQDSSLRAGRKLGVERLRLHEGGMPSRSGTGIFSAVFTRRNPLIPVIDDARLQIGLRENFIDAVFIYTRWQDFLKKGAALRTWSTSTLT